MAEFLRNRPFFGLLILSVVYVAACSGGKAPAPAATPDEAVTRVIRGLADGRPEVAWHALPTGYQKDITELVHDAAAEADPELWQRSIGVLQKVSTLLSDKRDLIFQHPMIAQGMAGKDDVEESWDAAVEVFEIVVRSELADLNKIKKLDIEKFLAGTGADVMEQMAEVSALAPNDAWNGQMDSLRATEVTVLTSTDDTATLRIERPGEAPTEDEYVRVEGKWIPKSMADSWESTIADAKQKLAEVSGAENPANKQKVLMMLTLVEGVLDNMQAAADPEQFNAAIGAAMGMAMNAAMAQAEKGGMPEAMRALTSAPSEPLPRDLQELSSELRVKDAEDKADAGTIAVSQADRYVGRTMWVTSKAGLKSKVRLTGVDNGLLAFERSFVGGNITFDMNPREIVSLRVVDQ